ISVLPDKTGNKRFRSCASRTTRFDLVLQGPARFEMRVLPVCSHLSMHSRWYEEAYKNAHEDYFSHRYWVSRYSTYRLVFLIRIETNRNIGRMDRCIAGD